MYVAVKGGERAIAAAHQFLADERRGPLELDEVSLDQLRSQLSLAVARVMNEGSVYDPELAALALKQSLGDLVEAAFLLRAYRTTLPRLGTTEPINTYAMRVERRISAAFKDVPGGQILGPTFDYTHRLIDFALAAAKPAGVPAAPAPTVTWDSANLPLAPTEAVPSELPGVLSLLGREGLVEPAGEESDDGGSAADLTREPITFPVPRGTRLQALARADEGWLLALGYSTQRGYGGTHPFAGEIRIGEVDVEIVPDELDFPIPIGTMLVTECQMVNQFKGNDDTPPQFTRGYGIAFGHAERRTMGMALVDRALRTTELGGEVTAPAQDEEFVLSHSDNVESAGFVTHLKLPHYVDFQAELGLLRQLRDDWEKARIAREETGQ